METIGFRRFLPAFVCLSILVLLALNQVDLISPPNGPLPSIPVWNPPVPKPPPDWDCHRTKTPCAFGSETVPSSGVGWDPKLMHPQVSNIEGLVMFLIFPPAMLALIPTLFTLGVSENAAPYVWIGTMVLLVPYFWFLLGRWIDRLVGFLPQTKTRDRGIGLLFFVAASLLILVVIGALLSPNGNSGDQWRYALFVGWFGILTCLSGWQLRKNREARSI